MSKVDVGVGDEFPTDENRREIHHHHHHYYRVRPGPLLRILLAIALVVLVFRLVNMVFDINQGYWASSMIARSKFTFVTPEIGTIAGMIAVLGLLLWFLRGRLGDDDFG